MTWQMPSYTEGDQQGGPQPFSSALEKQNGKNDFILFLTVSTYEVSFSSSASIPLLVLLFFSKVGIRPFSPVLTLFATC